MGGQLWPGLDHKAPTLIIGKVQMKATHLVIGHQVDTVLDILDTEKVPDYI
jgi:hypothetical protein